MLTGSDLLNKVKELGDVSKSDLVRACGYVSGKKDGGERLNFTAFYEALLEAKGVNLGIGGGAGVGKGGRKLSYVATVQGNGNLLIGKATPPCSISKPAMSLRSSWAVNRSAWFLSAAVKKTKSDFSRQRF